LFETSSVKIFRSERNQKRFKMNKLCFALVLLFAVNLAHGQSFWRPCAAGTPPTSVTSAQCVGTTCTVRRNQQLTAAAVFTAPRASSLLDVTFSALIGGQELVLDMPVAINACTQLSGGNCPTVAGQAYTWNLVMPISSQTPLLTNADIVIRLSDGPAGARQVVMCAIVTATILA
jgi:hypothetical protein